MTISKYRKLVKQTYSTLESHQYKWVKFIVISSIIFSVYPMILAFLSSFRGISIYHNISYTGAGAYALIYYMILYTKILLNAKKTEPIPIKKDNDKTAKNPSKEQVNLYAKILEELQINKIFKNSTISLSQLARILNESPRNVSEAINNCSNKNFHDLINFYRINEAIAIFQNNTDSKHTIKEVMYQVGYNSKSTFNTAFKKYTGKTPSYYRSNIE